VLQAAGGKGAASRGLSDLGSQQQQARSHVRAAGASGEELGRARNGHGVEALCASPSQPSSPAAAGRRGLWSVDTAQTTGSRSYRGYRPHLSHNSWLETTAAESKCCLLLIHRSATKNMAELGT